MKTILFLLLALSFAQLSWAQRKDKQTSDYNYTFKNLVDVPAGHISCQTEEEKTISKQIFAFRLLNREISNREYRSFVKYTRDSIARWNLGFYMDMPNGMNGVDWEQKFSYKELKEEYDLDLWNSDSTHLLIYSLHSPSGNRSIPVYPDTSFWSKDKAHSKYKDYFTNPKYDDFPVVGVSLEQAQAFCDWKNRTLQRDGRKMRVSLPTATQWTYLCMIKTDAKNKANRSDAESIGLAKQLFEESDPMSDTKSITATQSGIPNNLKIYNLADNVAEWVLTNEDKATAKGFDKKECKINTYQYSKPDQSSPLVGFRICVY